MSWDIADGFQWITAGNSSLPSAKDPLAALEQIDKMDATPPHYLF